MKSFAIFAAIAFVALTSASPVPPLTTENQRCKEPFEAARTVCLNAGISGAICQDAWTKGVLDCDAQYQYSVAPGAVGPN
ncbi:hypothetical protein FBU30_008447 [Linnemannia zychae]|nr:hypothetical protein FBU30_008447 [Linnemannia zychae]